MTLFHPDAGPTVAIVGGGAVGAALFDALVERLPPGSSRLVLFEKSEQIGRGIAYAKDASPYLLNQSAQTMSLAHGRPGHFVDWLSARGLGGARRGDLFCARQLFGDYVEDVFAGALDRARHRRLAVSTVHDEVASLVPRRRGGYRVLTRAHAPVDADVVVLALGNPPSTKHASLERRGFVASPYPGAAMCARIPPRARVAILGTGLSAIDAALALFAAGHESPVTMASRSGLLPAVRGPLHAHELRHVTAENVARATDHGRHPLRWETVLRWLELEVQGLGHTLSWDRDFPAWVEPLEHYEAQVAAAERGPRLSQSIGEALNPMIEVVWYHLAYEDKTRFLGSFYSRFMSHWAPIPRVTGRRVLALLGEGKLTVARGLTGVKFRASTSAYHLCFAEREEAFDFVVDATGAPRFLGDCDSLLLRSLVHHGTLVPHAHGGARVDFESLRVLADDGRPCESLFAIGHLTCGTHLFTSTLELNVVKAARVAAHVASELQRRSEMGPHGDAPSHSP